MEFIKNIKELISFKAIWPAFILIGFIFTYSSFFTQSGVHFKLGIYTLLYSMVSWIVNTFAGLGYINKKEISSRAFYTFYAVIIFLNLGLTVLYAWFLLKLT